MPIQCARVQTIPFGGDHGLSPHALDSIDEGGSVIALSANTALHIKPSIRAAACSYSDVPQALTTGAAGYRGDQQLRKSWY